jgi:hypothetical protein
MLTRLLAAFILLQAACFAQRDINTYYPNGQLFFSGIRRGLDTMEYTSYYKNGQVHVFGLFYVAGGKEIPLDITKEYYSNGILHQQFNYPESIYRRYIPFDQKKEYYKSGDLHQSYTRRGVDTFEYRNFYKNGRARDSVWIYVPDKNEIALGTSKHFHKNGQVASIVQYGNNVGVKRSLHEYRFSSYRKNGKLKNSGQYPRGVRKYYDLKGRQRRQHDYNNKNEIYVHRKYRNGKLIENTAYAARIKAKEAFLVNNGKKKKIKAGALISIQLNSDTSILEHCLVEGFSKDSVWFSKLEYDTSYRVTNKNILEYDSSFAVGHNQLASIFYSKHYNRRRGFTAVQVSTLAFDLVLIPLFITPLWIRDGSDLSSVGATYGIMAAVAVPTFLLGRHLFKTMIPKRYDMHAWKIVLND